jgi:modulator of FtsH protease
VSSLSPGIGLVVFLVGAFGLMFAVEKTKNSSTGVVMLLAFTFFMGLMLSRMLAMVLGLSNGASLVMYAFGGTAAIFFAMATLATVIKRDLSGFGKFLMVGAWILFFAFIANVFLQSSALMLTLLVLCLGVFSAFMLYDVKRVIDGGETNYISATLAIYLDLYNVFQSLLAILGIFGGERD